MKKPKHDDAKGFDVFKLASGVLESTFGKLSVTTGAENPATPMERTSRKKALKAAPPDKRKGVGRKPTAKARGRKR